MIRLVFMVYLMTLVCYPSLGRSRESAAFGIVIGYNGSDDPETAPLRYADDDAVRNADLLHQLGVPGGVVLLTRLDTESRALYPDVKTTAPTRKAVHEAMRSLNQLIQQANHQGSETRLYFFYSGHGDVENNQGYVNLEDGRFTRDDLLDLLKGSGADINHVIIDACKSYFMVFDRGTGGIRHSVRVSLLGSKESLPANTGFFLSTSSAADSHEWEAFQGGVFSHELRSAIRGSADADQDGVVSYQEAAAFVWTANQDISNWRFRPRFFFQAPKTTAKRSSAIAELSHASDRLVVGPGIGRHLYIEDAKGVRLLDAHPGQDQRLALVIPADRPLFVRYPEKDQEVEIPSGPALNLSALKVRKAILRSRGAEHVAFGHLFSRPFGADAIDTFRKRPTQTEGLAPARMDTTWIRRGMGLLAIGLGVTGGTMTALAANDRSKVLDSTSGFERSQVNDRIKRYNTVAITCYVLAGAALAGYLTWTLWPEKKVEIQVIPALGVNMGLKMRF